MLQMILQGRGGQGAQSAGNLLARAFFVQGRQVQAFATYGGARRGTPVSSFLRVDERPIRLRCDIARADGILCFDASLLGPPLLARADERTLIVVNSSRSGAEWRAEWPGCRIIPVDALAISRAHGLGRIVNSALLGAFARVIEDPPVAVLHRLLLTHSPAMPQANAQACAAGFEHATAALQEAA